ncbi:MAG: methionyl-tRNA formyltransferase [Paludibacter sp.]|jgi:methionyl-tRNA formyltransferase|nr:methionyl-tRNA formyltransferase [Paludibacter sp.]HOS45854.1 methionyl-tRNA formyltransferase [Paludibacter sp.]
MRIVFMGTPEFAVESLKVLIQHQYQVVGVVTAPDKPAGRGYKLQYSAVKQFALDHQLHLLQPTNLKDEAFLQALKALKADLQIVVAFRMLPEVVWNMPPMGTFNLHASLLPQYRGAAPINWAIINGEQETGVTTFFIREGVDTGNIILQERISIHNEDDAGTLHDKLMIKGAQLVKKTVDGLAKGAITTTAQSSIIEDASTLKLAPKLFRDNCKMDFSGSVDEMHNFVRGLSPYPTAWTSLQLPGQPEAMVLKVFKTEKEKCTHQLAIGSVHTDGINFLKIALRDGFIHLVEIQAPGKKRMDIASFLRGLRVLR